MGKTLKVIGLLGALSALLAMHSAHWAALQTVAWGRMILQYSQDVGLVSAIRQTFDGQHPCEMCHQIQAGVADEQKDTQEESERPGAPEALWEFRLLLTPSPDLRNHEEYQFAATACADFIDSPPSPPPRSSIC